MDESVLDPIPAAAVIEFYGGAANRMASASLARFQRCSGPTSDPLQDGALRAVSLGLGLGSSQYGNAIYYIRHRYTMVRWVS